MAMRIYKYRIPLVPGPAVMMPEGAAVLSLQMQNGEPCIWAIVDDEKRPAARFFHWYETGHAIPMQDLVNLNFIGTVQNEPFVFHLFERIR